METGGAASGERANTAHPRRRLQVRMTIVAVLVSGVVACAPSPSEAPSPQPSTSSRIIAESVTARDPRNLIAVGSSSDVNGQLVIARSADGGASWSTRAESLPALTSVSWTGHRLIGSTACRPDSAVNCLFVSNDWGDSWSALPVGRMQGPSFDGAGHGLAAMAPDLGGPSIYASDDDGATWTRTDASCPAEAPTVTYLSSTGAQTGYAVCYEPVSGSATSIRWAILAIDSGRARVVDRGASSLGAPSSAADDYLRGIAMMSNGTGLLWANEGLYRTMNGGATWSPVPMSAPGTFRGPGCLLPDGRAFIVRRSSGNFTGVYGSVDGLTWRELVRWPYYG